MTVTEYADLYLKLAWTYDGAAYTVSVYKYLANNKFISSRIEKSQEAQKAYFAALAQPNPLIVRNGDTWTAKTTGGETQRLEESDVKRAFTGKASPAELRRVFWMAMLLGLVKTAKPGGKPDAVEPQTYADSYLGVDCNGFVNNFLGRGPSSTIDSLDQGLAAKRRMSIEAIAVGDVMISNRSAKNDYHHVAVVTRKRPQGANVAVDTMESYGVEMPWDSRYKGRGQIGISPHDFVLSMSKPGVFHKQKMDKTGKSYFDLNEDIYFQPPSLAAPNGI